MNQSTMKPTVATYVERVVTANNAAFAALHAIEEALEHAACGLTLDEYAEFAREVFAIAPDGPRIHLYAETESLRQDAKTVADALDKLTAWERP
jgi:hypothetical protein